MFRSLTIFLLGSLLLQGCAASKASPEKIYDLLKVDQQPEFPGGADGLQQYLRATLLYPKEAKDQQAAGRVVVSFVINKEGAVTNPVVIVPLHQSLNEEALRIIRSMPKWKPALRHGEAVPVSYSLPISFRLAPLY